MFYVSPTCNTPDCNNESVVAFFHKLDDDIIPFRCAVVERRLLPTTYTSVFVPTRWKRVIVREPQFLPAISKVILILNRDDIFGRKSVR